MHSFVGCESTCVKGRRVVVLGMCTLYVCVGILSGWGSGGVDFLIPYQVV